jgi:hypothetical protein
MADPRHDDIVAAAGPRRAAGAGVYLLWARLVGDAARKEDTDRMLTMIGDIARLDAVDSLDHTGNAFSKKSRCDQCH